jgi:hypothetical protein
MRCLLVSHFHWDREWYRTFEDYRGRLVDAIDRVLDLVAADPEFRFVLDGQAILLEDYVAVRPARRAALEAGLRSGRLAAGPWYVQPDVLLPSGESLGRNLLLGRAVAAAFGPVSRAGYVPDSFGHPAQLPQLLAGFGIESCIYWRGNGGEIDALPTPYRWTAPDGSAVRAFHLQDGYFGAACLADDARAVDTLVSAARRHAAAGAEPVVLMNGFDHMLPDATVTRVAGRLGAALGAPVRCALLDDVAAALPVATGEHRGELLGGRLANLLPGVWSTRMPQKIRNRRCETLLTGWLEPWAAIGHALGLPDERASIAAAWRTLVQNHAHDSICGCSLDAVAARVDARFDEVEGLGEATLARILDRLAGQGPERRTPWTDAPEIVVFNPSPHARTDVVRVSLDAYPAMRMPLGLPEFAPLALAASDPPGFTHDGRALRVVAADDPARVRWLPGQTPFDVELVVTDVPAFGVRRLRLEPAERVPDVVDDGRKIETDRVRRPATERSPSRSTGTHGAGSRRSRTSAIAATATTSIRSRATSRSPRSRAAGVGIRRDWPRSRCGACCACRARSTRHERRGRASASTSRSWSRPPSRPASRASISACASRTRRATIDCACAFRPDVPPRGRTRRRPSTSPCGRPRRATRRAGSIPRRRPFRIRASSSRTGSWSWRPGCPRRR